MAVRLSCSQQVEMSHPIANVNRLTNFMHIPRLPAIELKPKNPLNACMSGLTGQTSYR